MACPQCSPSPEVCVTVYPTLNPCECDSPGGIEETGPQPVHPGPKGETPEFSIGSVHAGSAAITVVDTGYATRQMNWVLPAVPEGVPYTWTKVNTFDQPSIFEQGVDITGGTTTFGGHAFNVTPDSTFSGDVDVAVSSSVTGDLSIGGNLSISGNFVAQGKTTAGDVLIDRNVTIHDSTILDLLTTSEYPDGRMVLDSCGRPGRANELGGDVFFTGDATGLTAILPNTSGAACDPFTITSSTTCTWPGPVVTIVVRVSWDSTAASSTGGYEVQLRTPVIAGTLLDSVTQEITGMSGENKKGGVMILRARYMLASTSTNFVIAVFNNSLSEQWIPRQITYWVSN